MKISLIHCQDGYLSPSVKIKQNLKNNPYGLCKVSTSVCYLEDFVPIMKISAQLVRLCDNEDFYNLLAQIITFLLLLTC